MLPREILHDIFSRSDPVSNATYLGPVCREWHSVAEMFLYKSLVVHEARTPREAQWTFDGCIYSIYFRDEENPPFKHGILIEKGDEYDDTYINGKTDWKQLELLCRTLSDNDNRLASFVREVQYCTSMTNFYSVLSILKVCQNLTHLDLRGPCFRRSRYSPSIHEDFDVSVKYTIKSLSKLQVLKSEGYLPTLSMSEVIAILESCSKIHTLVVTISEKDTVPDSVPHRVFPNLRELCFLPLAHRGTPGDRHGCISFPCYSAVRLLSKLSLPKLASFGAWIDKDKYTKEYMKRCLLDWAPHLTDLTLMGLTSFDKIAANLPNLVNLKCNDCTFPLRTILKMDSLKSLDVSDYSPYGKHPVGIEFFNEDENEAFKLALPNLSRVIETDRSNRERLPEVQWILELCEARNIPVEEPINKYCWYDDFYRPEFYICKFLNSY